MDHEAFWSARYRDAGENYVFGTLPNGFLAGHLALLSAGASALSIADGEGRNSVWLAEQGLSAISTSWNCTSTKWSSTRAGGTRGSPP